jgi:peptidoglycan/LPS O-acetylase OafA/YrhL
MSGLVLTRSRGTLGELFSGRNNSVGFIRLLLAIAVVLSHSKPLGFGEQDLGYQFFGRQTNVGTMAVYGFFVLSGMLITRSARRVDLGRYLWHRGLRIFPGLWACLIVTAFVVAPLVAWHEGTGQQFQAGIADSGGPLSYLSANWWTGVRQYGIFDLLAESTPWGRHTGASVFDGALWSLAYEMLCYIGIAVLAVTGVLRQSRRFVLFLTAVLFLKIASDYVQSQSLSGPVVVSSGVFQLPLLGGIIGQWMIYLAFLFLVGAVFDLYRDRIPVHDGLGVLSAVALAVSLVVGGFFVVGLPAYAYLLVWLSIRLPRQLHWVGQKNDYSYGIYIYGFVGQQVLASLGFNRWGYLPFVAISTVIAFAAAYLSWHLVEKRALQLKGWTPRVLARWSGRGRPVQATAPDHVPAPIEAQQAQLPPEPEQLPVDDAVPAPAHAPSSADHAPVDGGEPLVPTTGSRG